MMKFIKRLFKRKIIVDGFTYGESSDMRMCVLTRIRQIKDIINMPHMNNLKKHYKSELARLEKLNNKIN